VGKWCEIKCGCPDREALPGNQWLSYSEYQKYEKKPRLAKNLEEWEERVKGMYECGHRDGAFIQFWPGDIIRFGYALAEAFKNQPNRFEIFRRISDWRNYNDDYFALTPEDAALWKLEIEQLKRFLSGEEFLGWHEKEIFDREFSEDDLLYGDVEKTLASALGLCEAGPRTKNPIEFYW
jgi:hypothetical protein